MTKKHNPILSSRTKRNENIAFLHCILSYMKRGMQSYISNEPIYRICRLFLPTRSAYVIESILLSFSR
jgi:hypothetical protein